MILVVEDNRDLREMLEDLISLRGHEVQSFGNAFAALNFLGESNEVPDRMVVDYNLFRMTAATFLPEAVSLIGYKVPTILISGLWLPPEEQLREWGVDTFFLKPFRAEEFLHQLQQPSQRAVPRMVG